MSGKEKRNPRSTTRRGRRRNVKKIKLIKKEENKVPNLWLCEARKTKTFVSLDALQTQEEKKRKRNNASSVAKGEEIDEPPRVDGEKRGYKTARLNGESEVKKSKRRKGGENGRVVGFCVALDDSCPFRPIGRRQENKRRDRMKKCWRRTRIVRDFGG